MLANTGVVNTVNTNVSAGITGQAATATNSDFSAVTGTTKPSDNATTDIKLKEYITSGLYRIFGNSISRSSGSNNLWTGIVASEFLPNSSFISAIVTETGANKMMGLSTNPSQNTASNNSFNNLDYAFALHADGTFTVIESNASHSTFTETAALGSYAINDRFLIVYDGAQVKYYQNSTLIRTTTATASLIMCGGVTHYNLNIYLTSVKVGFAVDAPKLASVQTGADVTSTHIASGITGQAATATSSDFAVVTGSTKPVDNATANSQGTVTPNPDFRIWPTATAMPTGHVAQVGMGTGIISRVAGANGDGYALRVAQPANTTEQAQLTLPSVASFAAGALLTIEIDLVLESGTLVGGGALMRFYVGSTNYDYYIYFSTTPTVGTNTAPGAGTAGQTYRWRMTVPVPIGVTDANLYYATANSSPYGSIATARTYVWQRVGVRVASDMDARTYTQQDGADVTSSHVSSGFTGQGNLATLNSVAYGSAFVSGFGVLASLGAVDLSTTQVTNKSLANLDGTANTKLSGIQALADVTSSHVSSGFSGQGALAVLSSIDPASSYFLAKGSIPPSVPDNSFSYTSTTTTATVSWPSMTVYRVDGTTFTVASGSQAITGLTAGNFYKIYPYVVDNGGSSASMAFVSTGGSGSPSIAFPSSGSAAAVALAFARGNVPMGSFTVATPASGSGGGGGGGFSGCFHETLPIETKRGFVPAGELDLDDFVKTPEGWTQILGIRHKPNNLWIEIKCDYSDEVASLVTLTHVHYFTLQHKMNMKDLELGQMLLAEDGYKEITSLRLVQDKANMVMLHIAEPHLLSSGPLNLYSHNYVNKS